MNQDLILQIISMLFGAGGFIAFLAERKKRKFEAEQAQASALTGMAEGYRDFVQDFNSKFNELKIDHDKLKTDYSNLKKDFDDLQGQRKGSLKTINELTIKVRTLEKQLNTGKNGN
jgi:archaellum component FlaC